MPRARQVSRMSRKKILRRREMARGFETRVYRWMVRNGLRAMWASLRETGASPSRDQLVEHLWDLAGKRGAAWIDYPRPGEPVPRHRVNWLRLESMSERAADNVLANFDWGYRRSRVIGGMRSRRGPKYYPGQLLPFRGLSKPQQARALGCSEATIARLRRGLRAAGKVGHEPTWSTYGARAPRRDVAVSATPTILAPPVHEGLTISRMRVVVCSPSTTKTCDPRITCQPGRKRTSDGTAASSTYQCPDGPGNSPGVLRGNPRGRSAVPTRLGRSERVLV